jgi:ketosteroid isomerase-like protein
VTLSLQEISDRLEIQELIARYSYALDSRDFDALDDLFTPDAILDYRATGAIRGSLQEMKAFDADDVAVRSRRQHRPRQERVPQPDGVRR